MARMLGGEPCEAERHGMVEEVSSAGELACAWAVCPRGGWGRVPGRRGGVGRGQAGTLGSLSCVKHSEGENGLLQLQNPRGQSRPSSGARGDLACALGEAPVQPPPQQAILPADSPSTCLPTSRLKRSQLKVRFCTNESQKSRGDLVGMLRRLGFDISEDEVTAPAPATCLILKERGLRPHLLIHDGRPAGPWDLVGVKAPPFQVGAGEGLLLA